MSMEEDEMGRDIACRARAHMRCLLHHVTVMKRTKSPARAWDHHDTFQRHAASFNFASNGRFYLDVFLSL